MMAGPSQKSRIPQSPIPVFSPVRLLVSNTGFHIRSLEVEGFSAGCVLGSAESGVPGRMRSQSKELECGQINPHLTGLQLTAPLQLSLGGTGKNRQAQVLLGFCLQGLKEIRVLVYRPDHQQRVESQA